MAITSLREMSVTSAVHDLAKIIDPALFAAKFGAGISELDRLVENKIVTIGKLMEIAPEGTIDPTSTLYNTTMFAMAGLLFIALLANLAVRPVAGKHYMEQGSLGSAKDMRAAPPAK
jgi:hypothetical protein